MAGFFARHPYASAAVGGAVMGVGALAAHKWASRPDKKGKKPGILKRLIRKHPLAFGMAVDGVPGAVTMGIAGHTESTMDLETLIYLVENEYINEDDLPDLVEDGVIDEGLLDTISGKVKSGYKAMKGVGTSALAGIKKHTTVGGKFSAAKTAHSVGLATHKVQKFGTGLQKRGASLWNDVKAGWKAGRHGWST